MSKKCNTGFINDMEEPTFFLVTTEDGKSKRVKYHAYNIITSKHRVCGKKFYEDVTICDEWNYRSNFTAWYNEQLVLQPRLTECDLEKDILIPDNKVYCPEACIFVPDWFNLQFIERNKDRGEYPMGATKYKNGFVSNIGDGSGVSKKYLGFYKTPEESHKAWQIAKISKLEEALTRLEISEVMGENFNKIKNAVDRKISKIKQHVSENIITTSIKSL
jgi:hypothetical protein